MQFDQNMMHIEQHNQSLQLQQQFNQQVFVDASTQQVVVIANPDDSERQAQLAAAHQAQLVATQQATAATVHAAHVEIEATRIHRQLEAEAVNRIQYLEQEANRRIAQLEHELNLALQTNSGPHTPQQQRSRPPTPSSVQPKALSFSPTHNDQLQSTQSSASNPHTASAFEVVVQQQVNLQPNSNQTNALPTNTGSATTSSFSSPHLNDENQNSQTSVASNGPNPAAFSAPVAAVSASQQANPWFAPSHIDAFNASVHPKDTSAYSAPKAAASVKPKPQYGPFGPSVPPQPHSFAASSSPVFTAPQQLPKQNSQSSPELYLPLHKLSSLSQ